MRSSLCRHPDFARSRSRLFLAAAPAAIGAEPQNASPLFGVTIPDGYRKWELVSVAQEAEPLDELRAVVGNDIAVEALQHGTLPFPDGVILVSAAMQKRAYLARSF